MENSPTGLIVKAKKQSLPKIEHRPGVYRFLDENKKVLYVGKAKDVRLRISSYFANVNLFYKTKQMLNLAKYIQVTYTLSEVEAFLLEATLIKLFKPKYNVQLKDDKSYPYIAISKVCLDLEKKRSDCYYKVFVTRNLKHKSTVYFGPYTDVKQAKNVVKALRRIFPLPSCSKSKFMQQRKLQRPCLYGQIGLCPAPCVFNTFKETSTNARYIKQFLKQGHTNYVNKLSKKLESLIKQEKFEEAIEIRNLLYNLDKLAEMKIFPSSYIDNPNLVNDIFLERQKQISTLSGVDYATKQQTATLEHLFLSTKNKQIDGISNLAKSKTLGMQKNFLRVEGYDISTLFNTNSTASMVVSENGRIARSKFRRFKIRKVEGTSDFDMLKEVIIRRSRHLDWSFPNMLLIDGGKQQVASVLKALLAVYMQKDFNKLLSRSGIVKLRKLDLAETLAKHDPNSLPSLSKAQKFAYYILQTVPVWGIYKPFDNFVAYKKQLELVLKTDFARWVQQIKKLQYNGKKQYTISLIDDYVFIKPKVRNFGVQHLRELRDHAHDFAKGYHKKLRDTIRSV